MIQLNKCCRFYKYMSTDTCLKVLQEGTLKFTKPSDFNDPFDCYPYMPQQGLVKFYKRLDTEYALSEIASKKVIANNFRKLRRTGNDGILHMLMSNNVAVTCFSTDPYSVPMWAHYANNHEGCVVEFQVTDEIIDKISSNDNQSQVILPFYVTYTDKRPPLFDSKGDSLAFDSIFAKSKQWAYEKEVRAFSSSDGIQKFSRFQITKILTGVRMNETNKTLVQKSIREMNEMLGMKCKQTSLGMAFNSYQLIEI